MFNVIQFFKDYNIRYYETGKNVSPGWVNIKCIFCDDTSNHMGWNIEKGYVNCWKCGVHSLDYTISKLLKISLSSAQNIIRDYEGYSVQLKKLGRKKDFHKTSLNELPGSSLSKFHRYYLEKRGFDPDFIIEKYGITGTGPNERWNGYDYQLRIIIPIYYNGEIVSFQGRDITSNQTERYKGCPINESVLNYKDILYNIDRARTHSNIIVVEGILDVWKMNMDNVVSTFGTSLTSSQIRMLSQFDYIQFFFDSELEAQMKAEKYAAQLSSMGKNAEVLWMDSMKDPGDLTLDEVVRLRRELEWI